MNGSTIEIRKRYNIYAPTPLTSNFQRNLFSRIIKRFSTQTAARVIAKKILISL